VGVPILPVHALPVPAIPLPVVVSRQPPLTLPRAIVVPALTDEASTWIPVWYRRTWFRSTSVPAPLTQWTPRCSPIP
jgi:hypothetical protein